MSRNGNRRPGTGTTDVVVIGAGHSGLAMSAWLSAHSIDRPSALAPGVEPIAIAANLPGFNAAAWIGVMATAGTPKRIIDKLGVAAETAMKSPDVLEKLASVGVEVDYQRPAVFADYLKEQKKRYSDIIKRANIKLE